VGWDIGVGKAHHLSGTDPLEQTAPPLTNGAYYRVKYIISDCTTGSVQVKLGTAAGDIQTLNGEKTEYITSNGTQIYFYPTSDFDGSIDMVSVRFMRTDWNIILVNEEDASETDLAGEEIYSYYRDFVTVKFQMTDYASPGCYRIKIEDECDFYGENIVRNGHFSDPDQWESSFNFTIDTNSGQVSVLALTGGLLRQFFDGSSMEIIPYTAETHTRWFYSIDADGPITPTNYALLTVGGKTLVTITAPGHYEGEVTTAVPNSNSIRLGVPGDGVSDASVKFYFDNIIIIPIDVIDDTYISNCIEHKQEHECTKRVTATCLKDAFGFNFINTPFELEQRIPLDITRPSYPDEVDDYTFSDGTRSVQYASSEKYFKVRTDKLNEISHDTLRLQRLCDSFSIDGVEYFAKKGAHEPDWDKDFPCTAGVTFEARLKTDPRFNRK
jgi:hypothetical protein